MREHKFRVFNLRCFEFQYFTLDQLLRHILNDESLGVFHNSYHKQSKPDQYTGLTDKNGVEIYESDILKGRSHDGYDMCFIVRWIDSKGRFIGDNDSECYDVSAGIFYQYEIIGNIHQNPELLEIKL